MQPIPRPREHSAGLAPLSQSRVLLDPREWALVERLEKRASAAARMSTQAETSGRDVLARMLAAEAKVWRQAAQIVREELARVDIDLRDPTVFALMEAARQQP